MATNFPDPTVINGPVSAPIQANPDLDPQEALAVRAQLATDMGPTNRQQSSLLVQWDRILQFIGANPFDTTRISYDQMYQMRRDAVINLGLHLTYVPVVLADWRIRCERADIAAFIDKALRKVWARMALGMMNSLSFGHSPGVKRFSLMVPDWTYVDPADPEGNKKPVWNEGVVPAAVWDDFVFLAPEKSWPRWQPDGRFGGIRYAGNIRLPGATWIDQVTDGPAQTDIDLQHSLWVVNEQDFNFDSIWGWPRTGYAWQYYWAHQYLWALANRFFERHADPTLIGYHPDGFVVDPQNPGTADAPNTIHNSQRMLEVLRSIRSGGNVTMPSDLHESEGTTGMSRLAAGANARQWYIDSMQSTGNPAWFSERFNELNIGKLRALLAPEQSVIPGQSGQSSNNVAQTLQTNVDDVAAYTVLILDDIVNKYVIPDLVRANFPEFRGECCKQTLGFTQQDVTAARQVLQLIGQTDPLAFNIDLDEICQILGIPQLSGPALKAFEARYMEQAQKLTAAKAPPMPDAAGSMPAAMGNGGGLAPGLNGQQLTSGLQAGEVEIAYVQHPGRIDEVSGGRLELSNDFIYCIERVEKLPIEAPGVTACFHDGKVFALAEASDDDLRGYIEVLKASERRNGATRDTRSSSEKVR